MSIGDAPIYRPLKCYSVAIGTANTRAANNITMGTKVVRLKPTIDCWVMFTGPAAVGTAVPLNAQQTEYFVVDRSDAVNVICNDGVSTGNLSVVEMGR